MPILNADKARTVIVCKRSMGKGYAGIENELFGYPNCLMLFGDAKQTITKVVAELEGDLKNILAPEFSRKTLNCLPS